MKEELVRKVFNEIQIIDKGILIRKAFLSKSENIKSGIIEKISEEDLNTLFNIYDEHFFSNYFKNEFKGKIKFSLSKRMNKSAGKTIVPRNIAVLSEENKSFEIKIGVNFLFEYYKVKREKNVGGIKTHDSLHALFIVFEHELIHLLEFYVFGNSSCKNIRFKNIAFNIFKHKEAYHSLPTNSEIAAKNLGLHRGGHVSFNYEGKKVNGVIYGINKRATVMVLDNKGKYIDGKGNRFMKLYVPLELISKI